MTPRSKEEVSKEIEALKGLRDKIVPRSFFGDDNLARLESTISALENDLTEDQAYGRYDEQVVFSALDAIRWKNGEAIDGGRPSEGWPLKEKAKPTAEPEKIAKWTGSAFSELDTGQPKKKAPPKKKIAAKQPIAKRKPKPAHK